MPLYGQVMRFDGHFWVERDGKVIDPWFPEYGVIARHNNCLPERHYLKCPDELVGLVFKARFEKEYPYWHQIPCVFGMCVANALNEIRRNGGVLVFGSMGFPRRYGSGIHWEYGGEDWTTVKQFIK